MHRCGRHSNAIAAAHRMRDGAQRSPSPNVRCGVIRTRRRVRKRVFSCAGKTILLCSPQFAPSHYYTLLPPVAPSHHRWTGLLDRRDSVSHSPSAPEARDEDGARPAWAYRAPQNACGSCAGSRDPGAPVVGARRPGPIPVAHGCSDGRPVSKLWVHLRPRRGPLHLPRARDLPAIRVGRVSLAFEDISPLEKVTVPEMRNPDFG